MKHLLLAAAFLVSFTIVATGHEKKNAEETPAPDFNSPVSEESLEDCVAPSQEAGEADLEHCKDVGDEEFMRRLREQILPSAPTPQ